MFDTYRPSFNYGPSSLKVTENRAPTDESVRLLREMEEAAEARVLARGALGGTTLDVRWVVVSNREDDGETAHLQMNINGKDITWSRRLPFRYARRDPRPLIPILKEEVAAVIAGEALEPLFEQLLRNIQHSSLTRL